jgi:hypothetical protein
MSNHEYEYLTRPDWAAVSAPNGFYELSADTIPRRQANVVRRAVIVVLLLAGLLGGAFQAVQSLRIVAAVVHSPHKHTQHR